MKTDYKRIAQQAAKAADDKKAVGILVLDLRKASDVADYIVIAGADSSVQMRAISDAIEDALDEAGIKRLRREGGASDRWTVLDYGGVVIHVLSGEAREFYRLEQMWDEAKQVPWEAEPEEPKAPKKKRAAAKPKGKRS